MFTGYSITSEYLSNGLCVTTSGAPINLASPFSVFSAAAIKNSDFQALAESSFGDFLGFSACSVSEINITTTETIGRQVITGYTFVSAAAASSTLSSSSATTQSTLSNPNPNPTTTPLLASKPTPTPTPTPTSLGTPAKIGIGVAIPIVATALFLLAAALWRKSRKRRSPPSSQQETGAQENHQPYLQQKAELEAEEKRKYELEATESRYELDGEDNIHEVAVGIDGRVMPSTSH